MARNWSSGDIVTATNLGSIERGVNAVLNSYEPTVWENGDVFTAEKLNNIEQGIENASNLWTVLTEESVITELQEGNTAACGDLSYSQLIDADAIKVTFNGTVYECEKNVDAYGGSNYGAPYDDNTDAFDWSEYPFNIWSGDDSGVITSIATQTAGTYTIKIKAQQSGGSSDFSTATVTVNGVGPFIAEVANITEDATHGSVLKSSPLETSFIVILYKGVAILETETQFEIPPSETNIYYDVDNGYYIVTGDCTITISATISGPDIE